MKDVRNVPLGQAVEPAIYFTTRQFPFREVFLAVQGEPTGDAALAAVREGLRRAAPNVPMAARADVGRALRASAPRSRGC